MRFLPCVSIIAESRIIDKIYLISWLHKVLWNCYFLIKLLSEQATSSEPLLFKEPFFFQSKLFRKSYYFSEDAVYWNSSFLTANLEFLNSNYPGVHRVVHHLENHSIKYHEQKYCINVTFSG